MAKNHSTGPAAITAKSQEIPKSLDRYLMGQQTKAGELEDLLRLLDESSAENFGYGYALGLARRLAKELNEGLDSASCLRAMEAQIKAAQAVVS